MTKRSKTTEPASSDARWPNGTEMVALSALKPYPRNARTHSRRQIKKIAASIERFGFVNPVLIDETNMIIAGHGRVAAAKQLGWAEAPTLRIEHLSEAEKRAYILADNRLAEEAGWDPEILSIELQGLLELDFTIELTGFDTAEIDRLLDGQDESEEQEEADALPPLPEPDEAVTRVGDLWELGRHRLLCGDATCASAYDALLGEDVASMIFTDPPYNVPIDGHVSGLGKNRHREFAMASGEMTPEQFESFLRTVFDLMANHSADGAIHFVCMDWRHMVETLGAGRAAYHELKNLCVWAKPNGGMGTFYRSRHELIFVFKNGDAPHINTFELGQTGRYRTNVWEYAGANSFSRERDEALAMHPTVKPVALIEDAIKDCSRRRQIVLDPFGGSGSTLIAAEKAGRRARLMELDPLYCDTIIRRWEAFTGRRARHVETGESFEALAERRRDEAPPATPEETAPTGASPLPRAKPPSRAA